MTLPHRFENPAWTDRSLTDSILGFAENCSPLTDPLFWHPAVDSEAQWIENKKDPKKIEYLRSNGWLDPEAIIYKYNNHGFRSRREFDQEFDIMSLGCSYTLGAGMNEEMTWPALIEKDLNKSVANLGVLGASIQTCFRLAQHWLPILKSKIVTMMIPYAHRLEIVSSEDPGKFHIERYLVNLPIDNPGTYLKEYWSTDYNSLLNRQAYTMAIQQLCEIHGARLIFYPLEKFQRMPWRDLARDFGHPGPKWHRQIADLFLEQIKNHGQE